MDAMPDLPPRRLVIDRILSQRRRRRVALPALAFAATALTVLAPGCDNDRDPGPAAGGKVRPRTTTRPTTAVAATDTTAALTPEAQVEAAYLEIIRRSYRRLEHPVAGSPEIADYHVGPSLRRESDYLQVLIARKQAYRFTGKGSPVPEVRSVKLTGSKATIVSCVVENSTIYSTETASIVDDTVNSALLRSELALTDEGWKLDQLVITKEWPGGDGCDR